MARRVNDRHAWRGRDGAFATAQLFIEGARLWRGFDPQVARQRFDTTAIDIGHIRLIAQPGMRHHQRAIGWFWRITECDPTFAPI